MGSEKMIGYITLGSNDLDSAKQFYDAFFSVLGIKRLPGSEQFPSWGIDWSSPPALNIVNPYDKNEATVGNGVMVALKVETKELVDKAHHKAIELGAKCEGPPGPRGKSGFYAGYFRDLDGNKLNVFSF